MEEKVSPKLAFESLKETANSYDSTGLCENILETLYSFFGESLILATELLEKCRIIEYSIEDGVRKVFKIITSKEQYTIYEDINFCHCNMFCLQVLESMSSLTCKHVLAVYLGRITNQVIKETVTGSQFVDFLNEQLTYSELNIG